MEDLGKVRLQDFARDLHDALAGIGPAAVVGYSMGGLVLQMVASDAASRHLVRSAVLLCSVPPRGVVALAGSVVRRSWRYLPVMFGGGLMLPNRADADAMLMNAMSSAERAGITCPVLVVSAEHDRISPPAIQPKLVSRYHAAHLRVAWHAHLVTIEPGWQGVCIEVLDRLEGQSERLGD